MMQQSGF